MKNTKFYECRYVRHQDPGDLLHGYKWRPAILVVEDGFDPYLGRSTAAVESRMFDKETGVNVGDTRNYCINPFCCHDDCAPLQLIAEIHE